MQEDGGLFLASVDDDAGTRLCDAGEINELAA
jgi:hypothetical protein